MASWDLTLLLVTDGQDWKNYVEIQLNKSPKVRRQSIIIDKLLYENPPELTLACQQSAVVVLLVTPELVDFMESKAGWFSQVLQQIPLTSSIVCFVLLDEQESNRLYSVAGKRYVSADWVYFDPGYEVLEVHQTIAKVLDIVEKCQATRSLEQKKKESEEAPQSSPKPEAEETALGSKPQTSKTASRSKSQTTVESQQKDNEPVTSAMAVQEEGGGASAASATRPKKMPLTEKKPYSVVQFFPSVLHESREHVAMVFKEEVRGEITLKVEQTDIQLMPERENEKVFTFLAPDLPPGKHKVLVLEGDRRRARCSLTVKAAALEEVFCSTHYLCQSLQVSNVGQLDLKLKEMFNASLPKAGSGLDKIFSKLTISDDIAEQVTQSEAVYPTLLHYAAAHGLSEFCAALLECPSSSLAYRIHNCDGLDPAELAAKSGFQELENYIIDFMEMQTAHEIYDQYIAVQPCQEPDSDDDGENYEDMMSLSFPPPSRSRSQSVPSVGASASLSGSPSPAQPVTSTWASGQADRPPLPPPRQASSQTTSQWTPSSPGPLGVISEMEQKASTLPTTSRVRPAEFMNAGAFQPKLSKGAMGSRSQHELIEVNEMVKSQEINLNEARMLFNAWQQRYGQTPSKSFKERQRELSDIQTKYKEVREALNTEGKSPKSFFARLGLGGRQNKPTIKVNISDPVLQRPKQKVPKVYTKSASTSNLFPDRISNASSASSSSSSRDSGWSQGSRDSHMSTSHECDSEKDEDFQTHGIVRRSSSSRGSKKRDSLGNQYLQKAEKELKKEATSSPPALPPRNCSLPPSGLS